MVHDVTKRYPRRRKGHEGLAGDVEWYVSLAQACAPPVLELGCGDGRVTRAIAGVGVPVMGLDNDPVALDEARALAPAANNPLWFNGDMRAFDAGRRFGLIAIPFRSLQLMPSEEACSQVLTCCFAHLLPGGTIALNISNIPALVATAMADGRVNPTRVKHTELLPLSRAAMERLLKSAGFVDLSLSSGFSGEPFTLESSEQVWLARAPLTLRPAET